MSRKGQENRLTKVFQKKTDEDQKRLRQARRQALNELLSQSDCDVDTAKELIDQIIADSSDKKKKLNYSDVESNIDYPFNKAASMGHVEVVAYMLKYSKDLKINLNNPDYPRVLYAVADTIRKLLTAEVFDSEIGSYVSCRDKDRLLRLEEMLLLLLSDQNVVTETLCHVESSQSGQSFVTIFMAILGKALDIFKKQDTTVLRLLNAMGDFRVNILPDQASYIQFYMLQMLMYPQSIMRDRKTWLTFLYEDVVKQDVEKLDANFLKTLMQIGYRMSMSDSHVLHAILKDIKTNEKAQSLVLALLEGVICCQPECHADCALEKTLAVNSLMPFLLECCKKHYIDAPGNVWQDHLPIIHYLIATQQADELLTTIVADAEYHELYQELKKWAVLSKSVKHHQHFNGFAELLKAAEASAPQGLLEQENDLELTATVSEEGEEVVNPYHTLKKFTQEQLRSKTLQKKITSGLVPSADSAMPHAVQKSSVKAAPSFVPEARSEETMKRKDSSLAAMAQMKDQVIARHQQQQQKSAIKPAVASSSSGSSSPRSSSEVESVSAAKAQADDGAIYAPLAPKKPGGGSAKPVVPMYKLTEDVRNADAATASLSSLQEVCATEVVAEKPVVEQSKISDKPAVVEKPVPPAKPKPTPPAKPVPAVAAKPASVSSAKPPLSAEELALKSSTVRDLKSQSVAQALELERLKAELAAAKQQASAPVFAALDDLPPPPPEDVFEHVASTSVAGNASALFTPAQANRLPLPEADLASSGHRPTAPAGMFNELRAVTAIRKRSDSVLDPQQSSSFTNA